MSEITAKILRKRQTEAEKKVWSSLRDRRLKNQKFRRQVAMGPYIADFVCHEAKLIIEIDGGQHSVQENKDAQRTDWLNKEGYKVVRFWNNEVIENLEGVLERIVEEIEIPLT